MVHSCTELELGWDPVTSHVCFLFASKFTRANFTNMDEISLWCMANRVIEAVSNE